MDGNEKKKKLSQIVVPLVVGIIIVIAVVLGVIQSLNNKKNNLPPTAPSSQSNKEVSKIDNPLTLNDLNGTWERTNNELGVIYYLTFDNSEISYIEIKSGDKNLLQKSESGSNKLKENEILISLTMSGKTYLETYNLISMNSTLILNPVNDKETFLSGTYIKSQLPEIADPTPEPTPTPELTATPEPTTNPLEQQKEEFFQVVLDKTFIYDGNISNPTFITFTSENKVYQTGGPSDIYYDYDFDGETLIIKNVGYNGQIQDYSFQVETGIYHQQEHYVRLIGDGPFSGQYNEYPY